MKGSLLQPSSTHKRKKVDENDQSKIFELLLLSVLILLVCFYPICQAICSILLNKMVANPSAV